MMDIFFQDPDEVPLPPEEVRIREFSSSPWGDGSRIRVYLEVDPFQKRPNAEISIRDPSGTIVAQADIIETITRKMELNMHLRLPDPVGVYQIQVVLYYAQLPPAEKAAEETSQPETPPSEAAQPENAQPVPQRVVVDTAESTFEVSKGKPTESS